MPMSPRAARFATLQHSMTSAPGSPRWHEETKEKDRSAPPLVADQPGHTGEGIRQKVFPLEAQTARSESTG
jgi:hypothetical protein